MRFKNVVYIYLFFIYFTLLSKCFLKFSGFIEPLVFPQFCVLVVVLTIAGSFVKMLSSGSSLCRIKVEVQT